MIKRAANKRKRSLCWNGLISDDAYKCILSLGFLQKINLEDRALYTSKNVINQLYWISRGNISTVKKKQKQNLKKNRKTLQNNHTKTLLNNMLL